jgi:hypothetical protein
MHDALLRGADQSRLGLRQGGRCAAVIAGSNGLFDLANRGTHARAARFVNDGSAHGLARGFLGGFRIGHTYWTQQIVTRAALIGSWRDTVNGAGQGQPGSEAAPLPAIPAGAGQATRFARTLS